MSRPLSELVVIDDANDVVRINGAAVAGEVFQQLAEPTPAGRWYRTVSVEGTIVLECIEISPFAKDARS